MVATEANGKFPNTTLHQDSVELMTVVLWAVMEEMKSKEQAGTTEAGIGARFGHLFTVDIDQHQRCLLNYWWFMIVDRLFKRPGVAGAVLHTPPSLID